MQFHSPPFSCLSIMTIFDFDFAAFFFSLAFLCVCLLLYFSSIDFRFFLYNTAHCLWTLFLNCKPVPVYILAGELSNLLQRHILFKKHTTQYLLAFEQNPCQNFANCSPFQVNFSACRRRTRTQTVTDFTNNHFKTDMDNSIFRVGI